MIFGWPWYKFMGKKKKLDKWCSQILAVLLEIPWIRIAPDVIAIFQGLYTKLRQRGMYEVLAYETTLALHDPEGKRATLHKCEKVRFLQNNIIAYQDQAWGDGEILQAYRCSPGVAVDQYRSGYKTLILISLREVKHRGDVEEFQIQWEMEDGFLRETEQWETHIRHPTKHLKVQVIFPEDRSPQHVTVIERNRQRQQTLDESARKRLPDGRWIVACEKKHPRLNGHYVLQWEW
jgi:hypothetical protein